MLRSLCITNHAIIAPQECHDLPYQKGQSPTLAQHKSHCFQAIAAPRTSDETLMEARSRGHALEPLGLWLRLPPLALPRLSESGGVVGATSAGESCSCSCEGHRRNWLRQRAHRSETAVLRTSLRLRYAWLLLQWVSNKLNQIAANAHVSSRSTLGGR